LLLTTQAVVGLRKGRKYRDTLLRVEIEIDAWIGGLSTALVSG
jgi:hypothetical protein